MNLTESGNKLYAEMKTACTSGSPLHKWLPLSQVALPCTSGYSISPLVLLANWTEFHRDRAKLVVKWLRISFTNGERVRLAARIKCESFIFMENYALIYLYI